MIVMEPVTFFLQAFQNHATSTLECIVICSSRSGSIIITFISPKLFQMYYCVISSFHFHFTKTIIYVKIQSEIVQVLLCRPSNSSLLSNLFHFSFCHIHVSHRHHHHHRCHHFHFCSILVFVISIIHVSHRHHHHCHHFHFCSSSVFVVFMSM